MRAFELLSASRELQRTDGLNGPAVSFKNLGLRDILAYAEAFPDDVDDVRRFVRTLQTIDEEFLAHGSRQRDAKRQG